MINNGSPKPIFDTGDERTYFKVELYINNNFINKNIEIQKEAQDKSDETNNLSEIEIKILSILSHSLASKPEIATKLGYNSITGNIKRAFNKLLVKNYIVYNTTKTKQQKSEVFNNRKSFRKT